MVVISNSSPIINLAAIGQLHLIQNMFGNIIVPEEVWTELVIRGEGKPGTREIKEANRNFMNQ